MMLSKSIWCIWWKVYDELFTRVNASDTNKFLLKLQNKTDKSGLEKNHGWRWQKKRLILVNFLKNRL